MSSPDRETTAERLGGSSIHRPSPTISAGCDMPYSFPLERIYLATEFSRPRPSRVRVVGTLLDSAFPGPPRDRDLERLCAMVDGEPMREAVH